MLQLNADFTSIVGHRGKASIAAQQCSGNLGVLGVHATQASADTTPPLRKPVYSPCIPRVASKRPLQERSYPALGKTWDKSHTFENGAALGFLSLILNHKAQSQSERANARCDQEYLSLESVQR